MRCPHPTFGLSHPHTTGLLYAKKWEDEGEGGVDNFFYWRAMRSRGW